VAESSPEKHPLNAASAYYVVKLVSPLNLIVSNPYVHNHLYSICDNKNQSSMVQPMYNYVIVSNCNVRKRLIK
jgi:hypothetical protein